MKNKRDWRALQPFLEADLILSIAYAEWTVSWAPSGGNVHLWRWALTTTFLAICFAFEGIHYIVNRKSVKEGCYLLIGAICMMLAFFCVFKGILLSKASRVIFFYGFFQLAAACLVPGTAPFWMKYFEDALDGK